QRLRVSWRTKGRGAVRIRSSRWCQSRFRQAGMAIVHRSTRVWQIDLAATTKCQVITGIGRSGAEVELPNLVEQALALKQVEQRFLKQGTVIARQLARVRLHRAFVFLPPQAEEAAAGLHLRLAD